MDSMWITQTMGRELEEVRLELSVDREMLLFREAGTENYEDFSVFWLGFASW